jgi:uncharacterized protein GlcG (DUF336 family)
MSLLLKTAERLIAASEEKAREFGINVTTAVVDNAGFLVMMRRMDGTRPLTTHIAHSKAYTGAIMQRPARDLLHWAESEPVYFAHVGRMGHHPIVATQGGMPVKPATEIIGGIGVSGGTPDQDQACCEAALAAIDASWKK